MMKSCSQYVRIADEEDTGEKDWDLSAATMKVLCAESMKFLQII
jgi:hypothetical protein